MLDTENRSDISWCCDKNIGHEIGSDKLHCLTSSEEAKKKVVAILQTYKSEQNVAGYKVNQIMPK